MRGSTGGGEDLNVPGCRQLSTEEKGLGKLGKKKSLYGEGGGEKSINEVALLSEEGTQK